MFLRRVVTRLALAGAALALVVLAGLAVWGVPAPPGFVVEGLPRIGWSHVWRARRIVDAFGARVQFAGWHGHERRMFVAVGTTNRMHRLDGPGATPVPVGGLPERAFDVQWSRDVERRFVAYALDAGGSELYRFFRYDIDNDASTALTHEAARGYAAGFARDGRRLAFTSNARNGADTDVYVVDVLEPGTSRAVYVAGGDIWLSGWVGPDQLLAHRHLGMERSTSFLIGTANGATTPVLDGYPAGVVFSGMSLDRRENVAYLGADLDGEFVGLHAFDPATGTAAPLAPTLAWDVEQVAALADGRTLALLVNEDARFRLYTYDLATGRLAAVPGPPGGFPTRIAAHPTLPLVAFDVVDTAGVTGVWTYDVERQVFDAWAVPDIGLSTPEPEVVHFRTFDRGADGLPRQLSAVVLRPGDPLASPQPVLIDIHGGPTAQALARVQPQDALPGPRPVVIRPNVRGSTGYGRSFAALDDGPRREDAVRDIGALLDWIDAQPDLDGSRVAVMGASYGGYVALAALARYGDRLRCGVDMFGIADLPAFLAESEASHYAEAQRGEYGDARQPAMRQFLASISPVAAADRIRSPLLVYQGANDIRVKPRQSRALVERVRQAGGSVAYIEAPGEGHGLARPVTQFYVSVAMLEFLTRCLGLE